MQIVPLQPVPSQTLAISLDAQACSIAVRQTATGMYLSLAVAGSTVLDGVLCLNATRIVRDAYLGFTGDLAFFDTEGSSDPQYVGLGLRWILVFLAPGEALIEVDLLLPAFASWPDVIGVSPGVELGVGDGTVVGL
ncbi:MAG TPA: hypothetical protein VG248_03390 [Caulobacteraceae bacterium]|jgi:hypothetical protein|nr:hypothetical protein [Caulobacteraceae bacterium]